MNFQIWWTFFIGTALICSTPGPNMLLVLSSSVRNGFRKSIYTMAGCLLAVSLIIVTSVAGVGALLAASPQAFNALKFIGAAYLIYIGVKSCLSKSTMISIDNENAPLVDISKKELFKKGLLVGLSNPKACLFAMAFFPQFIDTSKPAIPQFAILFATFVVNECACYIAYATGGKGIAKFLTKENYTRAFNIFIGMLFIGFGLLLLTYKLAK